MGWSEDRVEELKRMWADGLTASVIAKHLGEVSRCSVIGKARRLGLANRKACGRPGLSGLRGPQIKRRKAQPSNKAFRFAKPRILTMPSQLTYTSGLIVPEHERKRHDELEAHHCRYPYGDGREVPFSFCGRDLVSGLPYCEDHAMACYLSPARQRTPTRAEVAVGRVLEQRAKELEPVT